MMVKALNVLNAMNPEKWHLLHIRLMIGVADIVANGNKEKNNMSADTLKEFRITQTYTMQKEAYIYADSLEQAEEIAENDDSIEWEINDSVMIGDSQIYFAEEV